MIIQVTQAMHYGGLTRELPSWLLFLHYVLVVTGQLCHHSPSTSPRVPFRPGLAYAADVGPNMLCSDCIVSCHAVALFFFSLSCRAVSQWCPLRRIFPLVGHVVTHQKRVIWGSVIKVLEIQSRSCGCEKTCRSEAKPAVTLSKENKGRCHGFALPSLFNTHTRIVCEHFYE